jgi:hypothetical protein
MLLENISKKCHQKRLLVSIPAHNPTSKAEQHSIRPTSWNKYRFFSFASKVSGSLISVICKFLTSINILCLHFRQNSRKFSNNVSFRIFILILFEQIRHRNHFIIVTIIHLLSQNNQITIF